MTIRVSTWQSSEFDIFTKNVDLNRSPYAYLKDYAKKVTAFYARLGIRSAIWCYADAMPQTTLTVCKPIEYLLEVADNRVVAYVDDGSWSEYINGRQSDFSFATTTMPSASSSLIVATPLKREEVKVKRRYRIRSPSSFELIEEQKLV